MRNPILSTDSTSYKGNSQTKKIILIMIIVLITIIVLGGGIFAYTYFFTDVFLTEEQGFYKYIAKNSEVLKIFEDEDLNKYIDKSESEAYSNEGEISVSLTGDIDEESKKITDEIQKHKITFKGDVDNVNKYSYQDLKLTYGENDIIGGSFIQQNDYLGLKVNDIGLNPFIVLENNNLKQFAKNMGLTDEEIASIPDKIDLKTLHNQEKFTKEELVEIKDRYLKVITDNLTEDMFSKREENATDIYTLTVTKEKGKVILSTLIDNLKNDETIMNRLKQLYIEQQSATEEEAQTLIDELKTSLEEAKNELNGTSSNTYEDSNSIQTNIIQPENTESENLYINVYVTKRNLVKTEINFNNEGKIVLNNNENNILLEIIDLKESSDTQIANTEYYKVLGSISIEKNKTDSELSYKLVVMREENKEIAKAILTYTGLTKMTNVGSNFLMDIYYSNPNENILNQAISVQNDTINAQEKETVLLTLTELSLKVYEDSYVSGNEFVLNETTIKEALNKQGLDMTVSRNEEGTYKLQSNTTGNIYTMNSKCELTNTEVTQNTEVATSAENEEKTINISLSLKCSTTFGVIQLQELTESNMYIINNKSLEQLESLFTQLGERIENKIVAAYQNTTISQMITQ